jgi:hypothetical protein
MTIAYVKNGKLNITVPELFAMNREEIYRLIGKRLFENANRRVTNISSKPDLISPSTEQAKINGRFSAKGKNKEELIREVLRANIYLSQNDSTVKGAKEFTKNFTTNTPNLTAGERRVVWDIFDNLQQNNPAYFENLKRNAGLYGDSKQIYRNVQMQVQAARSNFLTGLAGDLLSRDRKEVKATAAERSNAIEEIKRIMRSKIEEENLKISREMTLRGIKPAAFSYSEVADMFNTKIEVEKL